MQSPRLLAPIIVLIHIQGPLAPALSSAVGAPFSMASAAVVSWAPAAQALAEPPTSAWRAWSSGRRHMLHGLRTALEASAQTGAAATLFYILSRSPHEIRRHVPILQAIRMERHRPGGALSLALTLVTGLAIAAILSAVLRREVLDNRRQKAASAVVLFRPRAPGALQVLGRSRALAPCPPKPWKARLRSEARYLLMHAAAWMHVFLLPLLIRFFRCLPDGRRSRLRLSGPAGGPGKARGSGSWRIKLRGLGIALTVFLIRVRKGSRPPATAGRRLLWQNA